MNNLKELRMAAGMSIPALSSASNVPVRTIEDAEKGGDCKLSTLISLTKALDVSIDDVVVRNRIFASCADTFAKASHLQPPLRTPSEVFKANHFLDAAKALELKYKAKYPNIFNARRVRYYCIDEYGEATQFTYGTDYWLDDEDDKKASE
ncbi:hypothetical protein SDC9_174606 [bioreactor metagenome]|uniref:HTH cro/C1-type domain-containing protein n=1 Tax=bioreactor metagenome TaxID=1076179 RepID=A0A645GMS3_9ZZZZ